MKTDFTEEYKNWIEKLSEENFNELILNFTKEYFKTNEIFISITFIFTPSYKPPNTENKYGFKYTKYK